MARMLWIKLFATASLALACGCAQRDGNEGGDPESGLKPMVAVRAHAVEIRTFDDVVTAPGQWRSSGELVLAAPFTALVDSLEPRVGDSVRSGETLGWLVTRESQAAVRGAELLLHQARDAASRDEAARALRLALRDLVRVPLVAPRDGVV